MSQLESILTAIQAMDVSMDGAVVASKGTSENKGVINTLPVRILTMLTDKDRGVNIRKITFGNTLQVQYEITDLMLWQRAGAGSGLEYHMPKLVAYVAAFLTALSTQARSLGLSNVTLSQNDSIEVGVYEYPIASGDMYFGVKVSWIVSEQI